MRLSRFDDSYKEYCQQNCLKCSDKIDFVNRLAEWISDREKWLHDFKDIEVEREKEIDHKLDIDIVEPNDDAILENTILKRQLNNALEEME